MVTGADVGMKRERPEGGGGFTVCGARQLQLLRYGQLGWTNGWLQLDSRDSLIISERWHLMSNCRLKMSSRSRQKVPKWKQL